jgi:hypothetical protein
MHFPELAGRVPHEEHVRHHTGEPVSTCGNEGWVCTPNLSNSQCPRWFEITSSFISGVTMLVTTESLVELLASALADPQERPATIRAFQHGVWDHDPQPDDEVWAVLNDLAYDLDFYEPDVTVRREDPSLFGNERAEAEIRQALRKVALLKHG